MGANVWIRNESKPQSSTIPSKAARQAGKEHEAAHLEAEGSKSSKQDSHKRLVQKLSNDVPSSSYGGVASYNHNSAATNTQPRPNKSHADEPDGAIDSKQKKRCHSNAFGDSVIDSSKKDRHRGAAARGLEAEGRDSAALLAARQAELIKLRRELREKEEAIEREKEERAAVQRQRQQAALRQQEEVKRRRAQLADGLRSIAKHKGSTAAAAAAGGGSSTAAPGGASPWRALGVADELEIERVLDCKSDYECLKLKPGASAEQLRRRFREMAVSLHPDKCKLEGAAAAFQRLNAAYSRLSKTS